MAEHNELDDLDDPMFIHTHFGHPSIRHKEPAMKPRVFKFRCQLNGSHWHVQVGSANHREHTFAKLGELSMDVHDYATFVNIIMLGAQQRWTLIDEQTEQVFMVSK